MLALLAGLGVLWRKRWGQILACVMAALIAVSGLCRLSAYDQGLVYLAFGTAQIVYAFVAFAILIRNRPEFSKFPSSAH
jgi:hypothetical protein